MAVNFATGLLARAPSRQFTTQQQPGDVTPFSFDAMGDWGSVNVTGQSTGAAALMQQIADSKAPICIAPAGAMQIGETQTGRSYDVVFDDAAFATDRMGTS